MYASWSQKNYNIQFDNQTGAEIIIKNFYWLGRGLTNVDKGSKEGYNFEGWYTMPNGKGMKITKNTEFKDIIAYLYEEPLEYDENPTPITIYGYWKENEYAQVYYIDNIDWWSWVDNMPDDTTVKCTDTNFINKTPTSEDFTFKGWSVYVNGVETPFTSSNSIKEVFGYCPNSVFIDANWIAN